MTDQPEATVATLDWVDAEIVDEMPPAVAVQVQQNWDDFRRKVIAQHFDTESLLDGVEKVYSTASAAKFFGRSNQWVYWCLRNDIFQYKDGTPIRPERIGKGGRRRFTLPVIREMALSTYRRGNFTEQELREVMAKILLAEFGAGSFSGV